MKLFPAIDLKNGQVVRLVKGEFSTAHPVAGDAVETARAFKAAGAQWVHMVDLDGARSGTRQNGAIVAAVAATGLVQEAVKRFGPERIAVGLDVKGQSVRTAGWQADSGLDWLDFARRMESLGAATLIFTDIDTDGTLSGPPFERLAALQQAVGCDIIASGGVSSNEDLNKLAGMGLYGAIVGKAYYAGKVDLARAVREVQP